MKGIDEKYKASVENFRVLTLAETKRLNTETRTKILVELGAREIALNNTFRHDKLIYE